MSPPTESAKGGAVGESASALGSFGFILGCAVGAFLALRVLPSTWHWAFRGTVAATCALGFYGLFESRKFGCLGTGALFVVGEVAWYGLAVLWLPQDWPWWGRHGVGLLGFLLPAAVGVAVSDR